LEVVRPVGDGSGEFNIEGEEVEAGEFDNREASGNLVVIKGIGNMG
jgi:hypothetical protein